MGIIISIFGITWAYNNANYLPIVLFVATGALFAYLKVKLMKDMRTMLKERQESIKELNS